MADFCRAVTGGGEPRSSADVGVDVVRVIEAVDASLALSGARVEVATAPARPEPASETQ
jgi:hypothetical protein